MRGLWIVLFVLVFSPLRDLGHDAKGVSLDIASVGTTKDLSNIHKDVTRLNKPGS
jgi:hypothetical protein